MISTFIINSIIRQKIEPATWKLGDTFAGYKKGEKLTTIRVVLSKKSL